MENIGLMLMNISRELKRVADALEESNKMIKDLGRLDENDFQE